MPPGFSRLPKTKIMHQDRKNGRNRSRPNPRPEAARQDAPSQWQRKYEHYRDLAQAANAGDAVTCEQHWQYAEHFLRLINGSAA
jgi:hypothetical protein